MEFIFVVVDSSVTASVERESLIGGADKIVSTFKEPVEVQNKHCYMRYFRSYNFVDSNSDTSYRSTN